MLAAKVAAPLPEGHWPCQIDVGTLNSGRTIRTYEGDLIESRLAADLENRGQRVIWLRPEEHELKQASLARMLASVDHPPISGLSGKSTVVIQLAVGATPGPTSGLAAGCEIVLASILDGTGPDEGALARLPTDRSAAGAAAEQLGSSLPAKALDRLVAVASGRAALIDSVLRVSRGPSARSAMLAIERAHDVQSLIAATTAGLLENADPVRLDALALAARLGYAHDRLSALRPAVDAAEREPWWQPLAGGWQRLHYLWGKALLFLPAAMTASRRDRLIRLVGELEAEGAHAEAIELCVRTGAWDTAAEVLIDCLDIVLAERTDAVRRWLARFPPTILARHPALSRLRTELALEPPRGSQLQQDAWVALHESCVALTEMRLDTARAHARRAGQLSRQAGEAAVRGYAKQLVRLTREVGRIKAPHKGMDQFLRAVEFAARLDSAAYRNMPAGSIQVPARISNGDSGEEPPAPRRAEPDRPARHPAVPDVRHSDASDLVAYLLGDFRLILDGQKVTSWSGVLGKSLLKYLMIQQPKPVTRGELLAAFWPGVPLASAKNRLHVALYSLRTDLRQVCSKPVVVHNRDTYTINPELTVWLDVEEFTRLKAAGTMLARTGRRDDAIHALQAACSLYKGDLIEDTRFAEWVVPERDRLATTYLDLLAQLARLHFDGGRYPACVDTCRRLLARDPCWEQAHRLVMRSYLRLDKPHRAVAQFELCKRQLQASFGMTPDPKTIALYESIRAHRVV
ncbi:AfsR/SARP family transcriptional regulator [Phytohabitans kaempferiae]|uniref:BTAD domain-containing putative transcriptional regulator n=1 Tax=Phytohabitans kaempferiae TaxID=1620943 RepID=A0ABV6M3Z8_9ACTN